MGDLAGVGGVSGAGGVGACYDGEDDEVHEDRKGDAKKEGADEGGPENMKGFPGHIILEMEMFDGKFRREPMGPADDEEADLELPPEDEWAEGDEDIVQRDGKDGGEFAATEEPGYQDGEQGLEAE